MRIFRALCILSWLFATPALANDTCNTTQFDELVDLKTVIDGDTLLLKDGRFVRMIGINTPELNRENPPAEPMAEDAKKALAILLKEVPRVALVLDQEKRDRYQRVLAHVFLPDGTNLQSEMLKLGMGAHIFFPPNRKFYRCYAQNAARANQKGLGIWAHPRYQDHQATELTLRQLGFYHVTGRIEEIKNRRGATWLVISDRFSFRIEKNDQKYFKKLKPETLRTHTVRVSGWIFPYKSGLNMRIHHPDSIEILD